MSDYSISVIIPTHNRAHTLARALDSVLAQTQPASEIIVVDDGSTDDTAQLLRKHYPSVRYLQQQNQGVSTARNAGIRTASSAWIALLDSDDAWLAHKLATQCQVLPSNTPLIHSDELWIRKGVRVNPKKKHGKRGGWIYQHCLPLCAISPSAVLLRRDLFDTVGFFDESLPACEDYDFWLRVCARYPVVYIDEALIVKYCGHDDQLSQRHWGMDRFRVQALEKALIELPLSSNDRAATQAMLIKKLSILLQGAQKRGKQAEVASYQRRLEQLLCA
jgi:glycosyltransferase involved in cell wall biosynthesis